MARFVVGICVAALLALAAAPVANASTTIGQFPPVIPPPPSTCNSSSLDSVETSVTSGTSYAVPQGGVAITSWSTFAGAGPGQILTMKIFRKVADPATYKVVGHDGPANLTPSVLNTFPTNIAAQPGDLVGFNTDNPASGGLMMGDTSCQFDAPGELLFHSGNLSDGGSGSFFAGANDVRLNIKAVVAMKAENDIEFGKLTRNKNKGTATLAVDVPGSGALSLAGKGVKPQRAARALRAVASKTVNAAGTVKLRIKAKGKREQKLNETGKARVKVQVTYTPSGVDTGDVAGDPNTLSRKVRLVKR